MNTDHPRRKRKVGTPGGLQMKLGFFMLLLWLVGFPAKAAESGDQVIVVYNTRIPESKRTAEYYAQRRQVPANQVFGFQLSTNESMTRSEFRDSLQAPLAKAIEKRKLWRIESNIQPATTNRSGRVEWRPVQSRIKYAVLCYGVPLRITADPNLNEPGAEKVRPEMRRNEAAVDSELALLPLIEEKLPLAGPLRNPVYATTNAAALHPTNGVLLVARVDGPTPELARGLVDKALAAETNGLWGRAYFDLRHTTDPAYKLGDEWIHNASEISRHLGFETVVDANPGTFTAGFPMSQIAIYMGWYAESACGPFAQPKVEFMPGAFAYHLHSFSARTLRSTTHGWVGPLLSKGATATMGCVDEPYLSGTPDVGVFAARFIYSGFSFGEAAYSCQPVLSWQTTVLGDPLYRPFQTNPDLLHDQLQQRHSPFLEWSYLRLLNLNLAALGKPVAECVGFLEQIPETKRSAVLTEKLADLYEIQGKPASAAHSYQEALKLDPSPQQRIRLELALADRLTALQRESEAYSCLERLLQNCPNYPDKPAVHRKLLALAQKLNRPAEISKYQAAINSETNSAKPSAAGP
jgi:uncharacterized protein (TIGR03790 family)